MSNITIKIELFGFLQDCSEQKIIAVNVPAGSSILEIKQKLMLQLGESSENSRLKELPENCVLSNEEEILFDDATIDIDSNLVALPPVCGG